MLQDLVSPLQLTDLRSSSASRLRHRCRRYPDGHRHRSRPAGPSSQRLGVDPQLLSDPRDRPPVKRRGLPAQSIAILVARCRSSLYFFGAAMTLILHWIESLHQTRGDSRCVWRRPRRAGASGRSARRIIALPSGSTAHSAPESAQAGNVNRRAAPADAAELPQRGVQARGDRADTNAGRLRGSTAPDHAEHAHRSPPPSIPAPRRPPGPATTRARHQAIPALPEESRAVDHARSRQPSARQRAGRPHRATAMGGPSVA